VDSLYLLIPIALVFCAIAIKLLLWAIGSGQYDDLDKEAWRILAEEEPISKDTNTPAKPAEQADKSP
jgi:cbb3-type cytochrome oxidase maturation protein